MELTLGMAWLAATPLICRTATGSKLLL